MKLTPIKTRIFEEKENLTNFIFNHIPKISEGAIIVLSSKIAALSGGRTLPQLSKKDYEALIKKESSYALKTYLCYFTIKDGMVMTNAGIDQSNSKGGKTILLPKDSYKLARVLRTALIKKYKVKKLGIIITDSMILPLRAGVIGAAVAYSGFSGVKNYVGQKDIYGRKLTMTMVDIADSLAAAASILMGEAAEQTPLCVIDGAPVNFTAKDKPNEIKYPLKADLYYPFLKKCIK
ncbi:coenzyme F420-0:L-glutamate ligase [Elusimicrobium simillimum]|uniref:coenzyme F420-0:L-glutamate ligase n=1 Tax=Elusimicrobium simillimum TaxID=3143438 RepID=UPI003C6F3EE5